MVHHRIPSLVAGLALLAAVSAPVAAQDSPGTPDAGSSALAGLGYPEIVITATDDGLDVPDTIAPGLTLVTFENDGTSRAALEVYAVDDQAGYDELATALAEFDPEAMMPPPLFYELNISGGAVAPAGESAEVVLDFQPGTNALNYAAYPEDGAPVNIPVAVEVTGEAGDQEAPEADVVATMFEMDFGMPDEIPAGPQIWEVDNTGEQPHFILLSQYPEPFTEDDVMALLMSAAPGGPPTGTPAPGALDFELFEDVFETPTMSGGNQNWYEVDLEPGYYVALCFIPDPETGAPHAFMGMYEVFTVV
ncbi:MAG TPA: hypothetical protein VGT61_00530 [Thermomicrobiales bacterium]|jgi:hypothetical protein|nr:hypothetical protein [Thermomicrobiales bacterium]